jgi:hypothetical protein
MQLKTLIASVTLMALATPAWANCGNDKDVGLGCAIPEVSSNGALAALVVVAALAAILWERRRRA